MSYQLLSFTWSIYHGPHSPLIHTLDDDSLLKVFSLYRPLILDESEADNNQFLDGGEWNRERWWFTLAHVCRRWRRLVLDSASHLRLSLVCARGTPVADMLAHSPPLPLIIDHLDQHNDITAADEQGITLALQHRDRVRRIRLKKPVPILQKLIMALDGEFPILEYLSIIHQRYRRPSIEHNTRLNLPETFRAPHLRHIVLMSFAIPIGSPLLTTTGNLVTLSLNSIPPSAYFHPNALLQRLSLMPQLEILGILFNSHFPSRDIERQLFRTPIVSRATLPNLRWFGFQGASAYLEALIPCVTMPLIERLQVSFFNQLTYSIPHLQQFMGTAENLRLNSATLTFLLDHLTLVVYPHKGARMFTLVMAISGRHLDWQVASTAQVLQTLRTVFSAVEHFTLESKRHLISSEWKNEADRAQWRELLGTFDNVKTLLVDDELVEQISRSLQPGDGESPTDLLPELQELSYPARSPENAFTPFVDARQKADRPVTVIHPSAE
jgi:hypothetical protein